MARNSKEYEMAIKIAGEIEKSFYSSTKLTKKELESIAKTAAVTSASVDKSLNDSFSNINKGVTKFESAARKAFKVTEEAALIAAAAVAAVSAASIYVGVSYEKQMSTVQALTGATGDEFEALKDKAKELGKNTQYSALEAGQAMEYMAQAGWKTSDMINGMDGVLNLAAASGEDFATVASIVTDSLTAFGLKASDTAHFSDVLAIAANATNTDVAMMGDTFSYVAPLAGALGYSIEDTAIAVGLMANSGIKASQAGTALRRIFAETTSGAKVSAKAFGEMTIQTANADGSMRDLGGVMNDLRGAFSQMSESEKVANAESIAGKEAMSGLLAIVNAGETDYNNLTDAIYNCEGAAQQMAEVRIDNLAGDIDLLSSEMEGLGITIYEQMNTPLRDITQTAAEFVGTINNKISSSNAIENFINTVSSKLPTIKRELSEAGKSIYEFADPFLNLAKFLMNNPDIVISTLIGIGSALITFKVAKGIYDLVNSFKALSLILTNPFALAITGVALAIGGAAGIITYIKKANNEMKKQNLAEHFGDIALSLEDLQKAATHIIKTDAIEQVSNAISAFGDVESIVNSMKSSINSINKLNWKVSIGMELSESERNSYISNIESVISEAKSAIEQKQYALSLSLNILTDSDAQGQSIREQFNNFYSNSYEELTGLGTKLSEAVNKAFEDDFLTIDEAKEIAEIQQQIASITEKLAGSEFDANMEVLGMKYAGGNLDAESFQNLQAELQQQVSDATADLDEALKVSIASAKVQLSEGAIDATQYSDMVNEFKENYLEQVGTIELKASNFQTDTIMQQYADELSTAMPNLQNSINNTMNEYMSDGIKQQFENNSAAMLESMVKQISQDNNLDAATQAALSELFSSLEPNIESLEALKNKYKEFGIAIPASITDGINSAATIGALGGNKDAMWIVLGDSMAQSTEYTNLMNTLKNQGNYIPETIANAITENRQVITGKSAELYNSVNQDMQRVFGAGFNISVPVNLNYKTNNMNTPNYALKDPFSNLPGHADGGIFNVPHIAWFAEKGPEAAIPLDNSEKAISLWKQAGQLLGEYPKSSDDIQTNDLSGIQIPSSPSELSGNTNSVQINYSPNLQFNGGTPSKQDIVDAGRMSQDEFNSMMQQYVKDNGRLCFR